MVKKSFSYSLPLLFSACSVVSKPHWFGRSADELPVAVSHGFQKLFLTDTGLNTHSWGNRNRIFQSKGH